MGKFEKIMKSIWKIIGITFIAVGVIVMAAMNVILIIFQIDFIIFFLYKTNGFKVCYRPSQEFYRCPTKARVATLMRTEGGNTVLKAVKQAPRVLPVVNT